MTLAVVDAFSKLVDVVAYVGVEENNGNRYEVSDRVATA